jgi:hypothetical protein
MWAFRLRCFALLGAGALALHELRYLIAYAGDAGRALDEQGHGYLGTVAALVAVAVVASVATLVGELVRGRGPAARQRSWRLRWLGASGALLVIYAAQELAEGMLASGHPEGLAGVAGHGGWVAVALAAVLGAAVAALLRGAEVALERFGGRARAPRLRPPRTALPRAPLAVRPRPAAALAGPGAGRAPPLLAR